MHRYIYLNNQYEFRIHSTLAMYFSLTPDQNYAIVQLLLQNWEKTPPPNQLLQFVEFSHDAACKRLFCHVEIPGKCLLSVPLMFLQEMMFHSMMWET